VGGKDGCKGRLEAIIIIIIIIITTTTTITIIIMIIQINTFLEVDFTMKSKVKKTTFQLFTGHFQGEK